MGGAQAACDYAFATTQAAVKSELSIGIGPFVIALSYNDALKIGFCPFVRGQYPMAQCRLGCTAMSFASLDENIFALDAAVNALATQLPARLEAKPP